MWEAHATTSTQAGFFFSSGRLLSRGQEASLQIFLSLTINVTATFLGIDFHICKMKWVTRHELICLVYWDGKQGE